MLLQAAPAVGTDPVAAHGESYFSLMTKGGVILIPIFLLAGLAIFLIADKWHFLRKLDKSDNRALAYLLRLIYEGDTDKAAKFAGERNNPAFNVIAAGLKDDNGSMQDVEESMQVESRMQIARLEKGVELPGDYRVGSTDAGIPRDDFRGDPYLLRYFAFRPVGHLDHFERIV